MGSVVALGRVHFPGNECDRLGPIALVLHEYSTKGKIRGISGYGEGEYWIRDAEDGCLRHEGFEFLKGGLGMVGPGVRDVFVGEVSEGGRYGRVMVYETTVWYTDPNTTYRPQSPPQP